MNKAYAKFHASILYLFLLYTQERYDIYSNGGLEARDRTVNLSTKI